MTHHSFIVTVSGVPGSGKTIFSSLLSRDLDCRRESTSSIARRLGVARPDPSGRYTMLIDEDGLRLVALYAVRVVEQDECLVLETVYPRSLLEVEEFNEATAVIVLLRVDPRELCARLEARKWPREKIAENCVSEAYGVLASDLVDWADSVIEVDTTGRDPPGALEEFYRRLESWRTGIGIDWMENPEIVEFASRLLAGLDLDKYRLGV